MGCGKCSQGPLKRPASRPDTLCLDRMLRHRLGRSWLLGLLCCTASSACGGTEPSDPRAQKAICAPTAPRECPEPKPRYPDVAPIFERRCASCHIGSADGPWPLDTYQDVADWASFIRDELLQCSMPPSESGITMPPDEREQVLTWIRCG